MTGRGGRIAAKDCVRPSRTSFRWRNDLLMKVAEYLNQNYSSYRSALQNSKKIIFLRTMREKLGIVCEDKQLKNGFENIIKKYMEIRTKLNTSGFGIDPEKDATLDKGWILKQCPYFNLLDEVLGTRPNVTPPFIVSSSAATQNIIEVSNNLEPTISSQDEYVDFLANQNAVNETNEPEQNLNIQQSSEKPNEDITSKFVKQAFTGLGISKKSIKSTALGAFSEIMSEKLQQQSQVEKEKLQFEHNKFERQQSLEEKKLDWEKELQNLKSLEEKEKRDYEVILMQQQQQFEIRKLELLLEIEKAKKS